MKSNDSKNRSKFIIATAAVIISFNGFASPKYEKTQERKDTIKNVVSNDRGVMLNAKNATEPRQVEIGLPMNYTAVTVNELPAVFYYWPNTTSNHWRGEAVLSKTSLLNISNVAIKQGEIGYGVDSYTELGSEKFKGKATYKTNFFGAQRFDLALSGPIAKNWTYTVGVYQNFDPGSFDLKFANYIDRAQFYTAGITHKWNDGRSKFSALYKYTNVRPLTSAANYAPFTYEGDGKVSELSNFNLGTDSYLTDDGMIRYMDVRTGKIEQDNLYNLAKNKAHEGSVFFDHKFSDTYSLSIKGKYSHADNVGTDQLTMGIYENATAVYADNGEAYKGNIQRRLSQLNFSTVDDAFLTAEFKKASDVHSWTIGLNEWYSGVNFARSTTTYYHEVAPNPRRLIYNGVEYDGLNASTEFDDGSENKLAAYYMGTWKPNDKFRVTYGGRVEQFNLNVDKIDDSRFNNFYLGSTYIDNSGKVQTVKTTNYKTNGLNYAFSLAPTYNLTNSFGFNGEINFLRQFRHLEAYSGAGLPYYKSRPFTLGRVGVFFNHPIISLVSAFTYARRTNDYSRLTVMSDNQNEDPIVVGASSGIQTIGWTTDAMITPFKNFSLHLMFTLQSPKYTGYTFEAFNKTYDFEGKYVTKQSKILIEIDPSYKFGKFTVGANFRYFSKQYANVGNSIYFAGRWETFANASYKLNDNVTFTANVVNFLNQKGAQGTISGSELITDASKYKNVLMAGNYIRPFTVEVGASVKF
ncbi:MAG: TonB-dependent receptor [Muribaculaceae bacterium]|nr:TonB-dependent receptor [Muribaculaceae bacterium]